MKKVLGYIFNNWKIVDYVLFLLATIGICIFTIISKFPVLPSILGVLIILCTILVFKKYILGYVLSLGVLAFYCFYLYENFLYGDLILTAGLLMPLLVYKIVMLILKKSEGKTDFKKWDYVTIFVALAIAAYPTYLLMVQMESNMAIVEAINLLTMCVIVYLGVYNLKIAKYLYMIISVLQMYVFIDLIIQLEVSMACILLGLVFSLILQVTYAIMDLVKYKKSKNSQDVATKSNSKNLIG